MFHFEIMLQLFQCASYQELYSKLEVIAKDKMGLDGVPFPLSALKHPPANNIPEMVSFMAQCDKAFKGDYSDAHAINLIKYLKENPPMETYENPKLPDKLTHDDINLMSHIFTEGIDLPGSTHNPNGHLQYFSSFFIDMYFGNYTEANDYLTSLSKEELQKAMLKREGYCKQSPIFAPIIGLRLLGLECNPMFTSKQKKDIRAMYTGCNENKHKEILQELIKLGADVNAHDINGYTPVHHAVMYYNKEMVSFLLKHGANPNAESRSGWSPLYYLAGADTEISMELIDILHEHNAKLVDKEDINRLRSSVETYGSKELAVRVREAHPRDKEECEKCAKPAPKSLCSACGRVSYCTPACQKLDWKFHKVTCQRNKNKK